MENHQYEVHVSQPDDWVNLWFIGDWHIGSSACLEDKIDRDIRKIVKSYSPPQNLHIFLMGDLLDAICYRDKRFDPMAIHPKYRDHLGDIFRWQLKTVREKIRALDAEGIGKFVGSHIGNHELSCCRYFQYDVHADMIEAFTDFPIPNLLYSALTKITVKEGLASRRRKIYDFTVHTRHGVGNVKTMKSFMDRTQHIEADVKVCGHNHQLEFKAGSALENAPDGEAEVGSTPKIWGFSGSYLRTYSHGMVGYGEERGYEPVPLGCLNIKVRRDPEKPDRLEFEAKTT